MSPERSTTDSQLSSLDSAATLALCQTLGDYGEAGALSHDLMLRAGQYATSRFAGDLDILLAAARMYQLGGELDRARKVLLRAGKLAPDEARTLRQLGEVLRALGLPVTPGLAILEAEDEPVPTIPPARSRSHIRGTHEGDAPASEGPQESAPRPSIKVREVERRDRPSQKPTRQIPAQRAVELTTLEKEGNARALAAMARIPSRRVSSGTQRAVAAAVNTPTLPTLRNQQRLDARDAVGRRPSGALRLPEGLRTQSGIRPGERPLIGAPVSERDRAPSSGRPGERDRALSSVRPGERDRAHSSSRPGEAPRGVDSVRASETLRPPKSSRIRLLEPSDPARHLDRYELIGEIASGGMATVFLARRDGAGGFQRLVAIKRLHPHLAHQEEFVGMFLDEARLAAAIHHPHVVPILESENGHYVVMEFIEGDTLAGLSACALARGMMLPRAVAVRIVLDALSGLHAAHQLKDGEGRLLGLVHRDCTPQNILVGADGSSRLTDFGVARAASRLAITRSQTVKGKVAYLSPEQATAGELDRRSDLFTMGIVLWEALAGRPLFLTDNDSTTISRLLSGPIPSVRQYAPDVSPDLDEVCVRALQRNAARRFPTAAAMAEALEAAARNATGGSGSPGEVGRCVEMLIGADLAAQRDAVRAWTAQNDSNLDSRKRTSISEMLSGRATPVLEIPRPPPLPQSGMDAAMPPSDGSPGRISTPISSRAPEARGTPIPASAAPPPRSIAAAAVKPTAAITAPAPPRAPMTAEAKKRLRTLVTVAAILLVGASSPLWMKRVTHLREKLLTRGKTPPSASTTRPRAVPKPVTTATAVLPADPPDPAPGE
jgi:serine/threonine protein kinase